MPGAEPGDRLIDLCGTPEDVIERRADAVIELVLRGQSVTLLTDSDAAVRYLLPVAVARGAQCRFAPPQDGVWRIDLAPAEPGAPAASPGERNGAGDDGGAGGDAGTGGGGGRA